MGTERSGDTRLLLGNEAIARGALEAGIGAVSAYPGTPSTEIGDTLRDVADEHGLYVEYAINEKTALETAIAASFSGVRSMAVMKHVGLNVASDTFMALAHAGVGAGLVVVVADDPNMWSSQNEQDTRRYAEFARVPVFSPASQDEARRMVPEAIELSESVKSPVVLRTTTRLSHSRGVVDLGPVPDRRTTGRFEPDHDRTVHIPANRDSLKPALLTRIELAGEVLADSPFTTLVPGEASVGVIADGFAANYVREALSLLDLDAPILELGHPYPLPEERIRAFLKSVESVIVVEEVDPVVEESVRVIAQEAGLDTTIAGKRDGVMPMAFELTTDRVTWALADYLDLEAPVDVSTINTVEAEAAKITLPRPPQLCPGCPHERVFSAMETVLADEDVIFPGDIGCYTLGVNYDMVDIEFAMGAGTGFASGFPHFTDQTVVATIGDSTFYHGGIPGLLNAIYNGADTTIVVLDNQVTAMTGQQPNPATGWTATGRDADRIPIEDIAEAAGADFVRVVKPYDRETVEAALETAVETEGVSVVVARAPCVLFKRAEGDRLAEVETKVT
ncbi:MAG: indolepyruvate ferredoxin oxidoreductase subunit alpha [Halodesulfurarchaeum sp.]